jgi:hypothetical protein
VGDFIGDESAVHAVQRGAELHGHARQPGDDLGELFQDPAAPQFGGVVRDSLEAEHALSTHVPPEDYTDAQWDQLINVNLRGTFLTNQEIFPYLVENGGGRIINFAFGAGIGPERAVEGYKAMGPMFEAMFPLGKRRFPPRPEDKDLPEYCGGDADADLAPVLVFLVGEGARFITAQIIAIDGGTDPLR